MDSRTEPEPPYSPAAIRQILMDALSPTGPINSPHTLDVDDHDSLPLPEGMSSPTRTPAHNTSTQPPSSPPARLVDLDERMHTPTSSNASASFAPSISFSSMHHRGAPPPSPLRHITSRSDDSSSPYNSSPTRNINGPTAPITAPSSPVWFLNTPAQNIPVGPSFLQAVIGLLERQEKIVPEHLFTREDVRDIVRKEVKKESEREKGAFTETSTQGENTRTLVTALGFVTAMTGGAGLAVFRRACLAHPQLTCRYLSSAWKGAISGAVGAVLITAAIKACRSRES